MDVTINKAKTILSTLVQQQLNGNNPPPVCLWGPPGVGKSDILRQIKSEKNIDLIDIRLSQMESVDLRGVPYVEKTVEEILTKWAVPSIFPQGQTAKGIIFFDEISSADSTIQTAAYQLFLDRKCGGYEIPPNVYVCAAGNRAEDHAISNPMSSALTNRLMHLEIEPDPKVWCEWAVANNIAPEVIGFIHMSPDSLFDLNGECERGWPSPRSWKNVSKVLSFGFAEDELLACTSGLVGEYAAAQFLAFRKHYQELGDIRTVMLDPKAKWKKPTKNDMLFAVATAIAYWVCHGKTQDESAKLLDGFFRIALQLPATFAMVALSDVMSGKDGEVLAKQILAHSGFEELQAKIAVVRKRGA